MKVKKESVLGNFCLSIMVLALVSMMSNLGTETKAQSVCYQEVSIVDDFENDLANWSNTEGWSIVDDSGKRVAERNSGSTVLLFNKVANVPSKYSISTKMKWVSNWSGLAFNYQDPDNFYHVFMHNRDSDSDNFALHIRLNGVETPLGYFGAAISEWHNLKIERDGSVIKVFIDDINVHTVVDVNFTDGQAGIMAHGVGRFDEFTYYANSAPVVDVPADDWEVESGKWFLTDKGGGSMMADGSSGILLSKAVDSAPSAFTISTKLRLLPYKFNCNAGLVFNYQSPGNYYRVFLQPNWNNVWLHRYVNGVHTALTYAAFDPSYEWHDLKIVRDGCAISVSFDGAGKLFAADSTYTGGKVGLLAYETGQFDDFSYSANSTPVADAPSDDWEVIGGKWFLADQDGGDMAIDQAIVDGLDVPFPLLISKEIDDIQCKFSISARVGSAIPGGGGVVFNYQDPGNYYYALMRNQNSLVTIRRVVNGEHVDLANGQTGVPVPERNWYKPHELKVERDGCIISLYFDGVRKCVAFDATFTDGRIGLVASSEGQSAGGHYKWYGVRFDNFSYSANSVSARVISTGDDDWTVAEGKWFLTDLDNGGMGIDQAPVGGLDTAAPILLSNKVVNLPSKFSISAKVRALTYIGPAGIVFNYQSPGNFYFAYICHTWICLDRVVDGIRHDFGLWNADFGLPSDAKLYELTVERDGATIKVYLDGMPKLYAVDATFVEGKAGLGSLAAGRFDDFSYTDNSAPVAEISSHWTVIGGKWFLTDNGNGNMAVERGYDYNLNDPDPPILLSNDVDNIPSVFNLSTRLLALDSSNASGLVFNYQDSQNYYFAYTSWAHVHLIRVVNGVTKEIGYFDTGSGTFYSVPHDMQIVRDGCLINVFIDGSKKISAADGTFFGGKVGLMGYSSRFDDFSYFANSAPIGQAPPLNWAAMEDKWLLTDSGSGNMMLEGCSRSAELDDANPLLLSAKVDSVSGSFSVSTDLFIEWMVDHYNATGIIFNYQDDGNYYYAYISWAHVRLACIVDGASNEIGYFNTWDPNFSSKWHLMKVERNEDAIKVFIDNSERISISDNTFTGGEVGLMGYGSRFDNFVYTDHTDASKNITDDFGTGDPIESNASDDFGTGDLIVQDMSNDFGQETPVAQNAIDNFGIGIPVQLAIFDDFGQVPPCILFVAEAGGPYIGNEGSPIIFDASDSINPGGLELQYCWDFDSDGTWDTDWSNSPTASHVWYDDWQGIAKVGISNGAMTSSDIADVTVSNVTPSVEQMTAPLDPVMVNNSIVVSAVFTDPGTLDNHIATWEWGDGNEDIINLTQGYRDATGDHVYSTVGVYTIKLTIADDDGGSDESFFRYIVVYDPSAGFVTGGGWISSPTGAYTADPTLTGEANFGFVSKYKKGATTPSGQTQFNFKVADLNFHSDTYDWLVVAGPNAKYKGTGTINSTGDYGFMLTAVDGQVSGGGGVDKFRIKIWEKATDEIVYDNKNAAGDDSYDAQEIGGGSIVIHQANAAPMDGSSLLPEDTCALAPFPNPSNPEVWIPYQLSADSQVFIHIYDTGGRMVRMLDLGPKPIGFYTTRDKAAYWDGKNEAGEQVSSGVYFYTIQAGEFTATKKMVIAK